MGERSNIRPETAVYEGGRMTETAPATGLAAPSKSLFARAVGVIFAPKDTYADIAARPRILGALVLVWFIVTAVSTTFSSTELGKRLALEQTISYMEGFGMQVSDEMYNQMETRMMNQGPIPSLIATAVIMPLAAAIMAGIVLAVFTAILGGDAKYKQVYAIVVYSGFLLALQTLFVYPMFYLKESMSSPTSLAVFLPFLDESSFTGRLVGAVDLFRLWWIVNLSIGIGVLYKRRTQPIVWSLLAVYAVIAIVIAAAGAALSGV